MRERQKESSSRPPVLHHRKQPAAREEKCIKFCLSLREDSSRKKETLRNTRTPNKNHKTIRHRRVHLRERKIINGSEKRGDFSSTNWTGISASFRSAAVGIFSKLLQNCFEESCKLKVRRIECLAQLSDKAKARKGNRSRHRQMFCDN